MVTVSGGVSCNRELRSQMLEACDRASLKLGKSAGKDVAANKATYPAVIGLEKSRAEARRLTTKAHSALKPLGERGAVLRALADYLLQREY